MSRHAGNLYHPVNKYPVEVYEGFSWPCLFFGGLWYLYKGIYAWAAIAIVAAILTSGISHIFFPFFANKQHIDSLLKKGYLRKEEEAVPPMRTMESVYEPERFQEATKTCPFCAETIKKEAKVCKHCGRDLIEKISDTAGAKCSSCGYQVNQNDTLCPSCGNRTF